ncbi:hypothetical protein BMR1_03g02075 [Babesia microti strain RI]|uniref:Programmed cell death protein 2 C-terminal domain-containing protein n=1 Tax=Babesia microti (strain RI) TaxID=1133968 RepID=A0A1R4ABQ2_BABMR|nr:hypothetical protein BMR1_03g02075 [Babesia microti strain RI]SJK86418.1 hypothetical protein BMR1_03g02075 [Babesia microti strain RI]|eukprot:XP_012649025.2 hypothetical protein BMR1_03g02075 [Babesia microti strain RI]
MMIGYISKALAYENYLISAKDKVLCQIGCSDRDENVCAWNPHLLNCGICDKELTFLMQIIKNVAETTTLIFYVFFCANFETKCALTVRGWRVLRNSSNVFVGYMKFPKHLPATGITFKKIERGTGNKINSSSKEYLLLCKYNQRNGDDDADEWAADDGDKGWVGEMYERDKYKKFIKLQDEIAKDPKQVIRCTDKPLLIHELPQLPNCPDCSSQLCFAFQLLPTLGYHLSKRYNLTEYQTDVLCNNLLVFSCPNFCTGGGADEIVHEFTVLQMEF